MQQLRIAAKEDQLKVKADQFKKLKAHKTDELLNVAGQLKDR